MEIDIGIESFTIYDDTVHNALNKFLDAHLLFAALFLFRFDF